NRPRGRAQPPERGLVGMPYPMVLAVQVCQEDAARALGRVRHAPCLRHPAFATGVSLPPVFATPPGTTGPPGPVDPILPAGLVAPSPLAPADGPNADPAYLLSTVGAAQARGAIQHRNNGQRPHRPRPPA